MRNALALLRASFLTSTSYRLGTAMSFVGLFATIIPVYFVAGALQPLVEGSIRLEGGAYLGFLLVGIGATYVLSATVTALPTAVAGSIGSGTFEALLVTSAGTPSIIAGLAGFAVLQSLLRAALLIGGAALLGVPVFWSALPATLLVVALTIVAYGAVGVVLSALILRFRTAGPLGTAIVTVSMLLGGVYYSTTVIPSWLRDLADIVPLSYSLRAARGMLLAGLRFSAVASDIATLAVFAATLAAVAGLVFASALQEARRAGTLSQY